MVDAASVVVMNHSARDYACSGAEWLAGIEPRIRQLTVAALGIDPEDLSPGVSLTDDLAADSLDLLELALLVENEFGIVVPEAAIDHVRTYRDLVLVVADAIAAAHDRARPTADGMLVVRTRVVSRAARGSMERATPLTPYAAESIAEDALRAGPGATLDIVVRSSDDAGAVPGVERTFSWLRQRGVELHVRADPMLAG